MKTRFFIPLVFVALFILVVSTACALPFGNKETQEPVVIVVTATPQTQGEVVQPPATEPPAVPTQETAPTQEVAPSEAPSEFFTDEFDNGIENYTAFQISEGGMLLPDISPRAEVEVEDGKAKFKLTGYNIYYYLVSEQTSYDDVRIDIEVENIGTNNNSVSLVCRYDKEFGWYEFNITSSGLWDILYYDEVMYKGYRLVANGGSTRVKMGRDTNTYTAICKGNELTLYINDTLTKTIKHKDLKSGKAGFGISSYGATPVIMSVPWIKFSTP